MSVEMLKLYPDTQDYFDKYRRYSDWLNGDFIKTSMKYFDESAYKYIIKRSNLNKISARADKEKREIVEKIKRVIERELEEFIKEQQEKYNAVIEKYQKELIEDSADKSESYIEAQKSQFNMEIEGIDRKFIKGVEDIFSKDIKEMGELLEKSAKRYAFDDKLREINDSVKETYDNIVHNIDYNQGYYKNKSDDFGRDAITDTARSVIMTNRENENTRENDYVMVNSQDFNHTKEMPDKFEQYQKVIDSNSLIKDSISPDVEKVFSAYGISAKIENGVVIASDQNGEELTVVNYSYDGFELSDSIANRYIFTTNGIFCSLTFVSQNMNANESEEANINDVYFDKESNQSQVNLSNGTKLLIDLNKRQITVEEGYSDTKNIDIPDDLEDLKEIVEYYKNNQRTRV